MPSGTSRRRVVGMLGVGLLAWLSGTASAPAVRTAAPGAPPARPAPVPAPSPIPDAGLPIVLTVDDGLDPEVVAGYVDFAARTGVHLTFCPNGIYASSWQPTATLLRPMIEAGQVQLMNHTYSHPDLTDLSTARIRDELERNEDWIMRAFGTTSRPYYRPPYGVHSDRVDAVAEELGFGRTVLWTGSYGDSTLVTPEYLLAQAHRYYTPGTIVLGHANHPTILRLFDPIAALLAERDLRPVTVDEFYGTARPSLWRARSARSQDEDGDAGSSR